jgi:putative CocE/NonD family hydrolase
MPAPATKPLQPREVRIRVHDGVEIAVALYMPDGDGPFPVLLAASPYRYDNNSLPASPQFLWRETGPIEFYVGEGYVYAHMDVRGSGKSGGEFRLLDRAEQKDLHDVIEWLGHQPWSNGKVGGIGQSYFCMAQWWMAIGKPPALACIAAFDGMNDLYRASVYQGGILGDFLGSYWWNQNRIINRHPANGEHPREQSCDLNLLIQQHPTFDDFWRERAAAARLHEIEVPLYSVGVWGKVDLHTRGNIDGFRRANGPKKLKMIGPINAFVANREFGSAEMHARVLLPFYDHYLKGKKTDYLDRPAVEYFVRGADATRSAETWPPAGVRYVTWHLGGQKTGSVTSLNDGSLTREASAGESKVSYAYPNPGSMQGVVGFGPNNAPDPARRVLTFNTAPLERDLEIAGPIKLLLFASSTRSDMDFFVKLSEQMPRRRKIAPRISIPPISGSPRDGCAPRTARSMRRKAPTWSRTIPTPIRSRSSPGKSTASTSASSRWRTASNGEAACGSRSSTAIPPSPTSCGRTITSRPRSAPIRSIIPPSIPLH